VVSIDALEKLPELSLCVLDEDPELFDDDPVSL
jgi:hypothetical protein